VSDVVKDYSHTVLWRLADKIPREHLNASFASLRAKAEKDFRNEGWQGAIRYQRSVDVRYRGQGYELPIPFTTNLIRDFRREHQRRYGYNYPARELELVTLRLRAIVKSPRPIHTYEGRAVHPSRAQLGSGDGKKFSVADRMPRHTQVFFDGKKLPTSIRTRDSLQTGRMYSSPAVVCEYSATTIVPPRTRFRIDKAGNLLIETQAPRR
jgi:N-methylhydantoinase A